MEVKGYCKIKKDATTGQSAISLDKFKGQICRVFEFAHDGGVLVIDSGATGLATFDKCDVQNKFECKQQGSVLMPPKLNTIEELLYVGKVTTREGGYNDILKNMVITASLSKGEFYDGFLFQQEQCEK